MEFFWTASRVNDSTRTILNAICKLIFLAAVLQKILLVRSISGSNHVISSGYTFSVNLLDTPYILWFIAYHHTKYGISLTFIEYTWMREGGMNRHGKNKRFRSAGAVVEERDHRPGEALPET
jgi:hypothetical protein